MRKINYFPNIKFTLNNHFWNIYPFRWGIIFRNYFIKWKINYNASQLKTCFTYFICTITQIRATKYRHNDMGHTFRQAGHGCRYMYSVCAITKSSLLLVSFFFTLKNINFFFIPYEIVKNRCNLFQFFPKKKRKKNLTKRREFKKKILLIRNVWKKSF